MATLTVTKTYDDSQVLTEADLDGIKTSIETFVNSTKLDSDNIQTGGIATSNFAAGAVDTTALGAASVTVAKLAADVAALLVPPGTIHAYSATTAPTGYLLCDGSAVSRVTYATLFAITGEKYGEGNNTTTFNLPDFRGRFLRGYDASAGRDPDAAGRTAMATGGDSGDAIGTLQTYKTKLPNANFTFSGNTGAESLPHTHNFINPVLITGAASQLVVGGGQGYDTQATSSIENDVHTHAYNGIIFGGDTETRPANAAVNYIIKT